MPPSSSKKTLPVAVKTSVTTRLAVGIAIGFIAGILGGSYGFALLSNKLTPVSKAPLGLAPLGGPQAQNPTQGNTKGQPGTCPDGSPIPSTGVCNGTPNTPATPCGTDMKMGSDGMCHPTTVVPCLDTCANDARDCASTGNSTQICTQRLSVCVDKCQPAPGTPKRCPDGSLMSATGTCPAPKVPCLTQCNNAYTNCAYSTTNNATTQQAYCISQLNVCTNQCTPTTPTTGGTTPTTCPTGQKMYGNVCR